MTGKGGKFLYHILGGGIVALWLVMIVLLVREVNLHSSHPRAGSADDPVLHLNAQREWKEIYLKGRKVGYAVNTVKPFDGGYFIREEIFLRLNLMGLGSALYTATQTRVDESFRLRSFDFAVSSGVVGFNLSGRMEGGDMVIETGKGKDLRTRRIPMGEPPMIGAGMGPFFKSRKIEVGDTFSFPLFDPSTMARTELVIRVAARDSLNIRNINYDALRLESEMWGKPFTVWVDREGAVLKEEGLMGLTTLRSSAAMAPENLEGETGVDLYEMTAVVPDRALPDPGRLAYLKLGFDGMEGASLSEEVLNGPRQTYRHGIMEITRENLPPPLPYDLSGGPSGAGTAPFLQPEFNIESDNREIVKLARMIAGKDPDPVSVTGKLMAWVYHNLEKRPVLSMPSALEVLHTRMGDCNEHATLLTALLRASGIPARLAIGLVYTRSKFFYHAWNEAYLGEWISLDATMNQMPADVTHVKLIEGNLDKQVEIAGLIGMLKMKILDYRHD